MFFFQLTKTALALEYLPGGDFAGVLQAQGGKLSEERARYDLNEKKFQRLVKENSWASRKCLKLSS